MLYLHPPYHVVDGITILPDHDDPRQFYYLPNAPRLAVRDAGDSGADVPQLQLLKYRGEAGTGGFLNLDVHLGLGEEELAGVRDELRQREDLDGEPRLGSLPVVDGTVRLMLFGARSGEGGEPAAGTDDGATGPQFVLRIDHAAKPALYGRNEAAFSVELGPEGVTALEEALKGEMSPIGIVYSLDYHALRPAYTVQVHADWKRVYDHMHSHFSAEALFSSVEIDRQVDELIENRHIQLDVDTFVPESEAGEDLIERRDQAVTEVQSMVTDAFFEPSIEPDTREEDSGDGGGGIGRTVDRLVGSLGSFRLKKQSYERIDKKRLDVSMRERTTVRRSIHPQGHLTGLFRVLRDQGLSMDRFVRSVSLDDPWFQRRTVEVINRSDFEKDGIKSIQVELSYGGERRDLVLEAAGDRKTVEWPSIVEDGAVKPEVEYRYTVRFRSGDGAGRPVKMTSDENVETGQKAEIDTRELYGLAEVAVVALDFPWQEYPAVEVELRYEDASNDLRQRANFRLSEEETEKVWPLFLLDRSNRTFRYRITYRAADHEDETTAWKTADGGDVTVRDPYPRHRELTVVAAFPWEEVQNVFVDLTYEDPDNDVCESRSLTFSGSSAAPSTVRFDLRDPNRRLVEYQATVVYGDGRVRKVPPSVTLERRIILTPDARGHRLVRLRPEPTSFDSVELERMEAELQYENSDDPSLQREQSYTLRSKDDAAEFEYEYPEGGTEEYRYRVRYIYENGLSKSTDWRGERATDLVLPVASSQ